MTLHAAQLLRSLGAGIVPAPSPGSGATPGALDFAALLGRARAGELTSARPVRVDDAAGVDLTPGQLERLARATDAADAAGVERLFAVIDGAGVVIDVRSRTIVSAVPLDAEPGSALRPADVLTGVDAAAVIPPGDDDAPVITLSRGGPGDRDALAPLAGLIENTTLLAGLVRPSAPTDTDFVARG